MRGVFIRVIENGDGSQLRGKQCTQAWAQTAATLLHKVDEMCGRRVCASAPVCVCMRTCKRDGETYVSTEGNKRKECVLLLFILLFRDLLLLNYLDKLGELNLAAVIIVNCERSGAAQTSTQVRYAESHAHRHTQPRAKTSTRTQKGRETLCTAVHSQDVTHVCPLPSRLDAVGC